MRTYGLFAANPFGQKDFPNPEAAKQGAVTIKKGDSLTLRYRVLVASRQDERGGDRKSCSSEFADRVIASAAPAMQQLKQSLLFF